MKRFVMAAGITIAVTFLVVLILGLASEIGMRDALILGGTLGGWASVTGIVIGGALFYLLRRFLPVRWYTRLACALLSNALCFNASGLMVELGVGNFEELEAAVPFLILAPIIGTAFGAGLGQRQERRNSPRP